MYAIIGLLRGVDLKIVNSFFIESFESHPRKTTSKKISSALITTSLPGILPTLNSGEKSIEKTKKIMATSIFKKAITNIRDDRIKTAGKVNGNFIMLKRTTKAREKREMVTARFVCLLSIYMFFIFYIHKTTSILCGFRKKHSGRQ
jgi:hypothetical protein